MFVFPTFLFLFVSIVSFVPAEPSSLTLKLRKHCAFFRAQMHRCVVTHTQTQPRSDGAEDPRHPPLYQQVTLLTCKFKCQITFSSKAVSALWMGGILESGNSFWQIVRFTYCMESYSATRRYTLKKTKQYQQRHMDYEFILKNVFLGFENTHDWEIVWIAVKTIS